MESPPRLRFFAIRSGMPVAQVKMGKMTIVILDAAVTEQGVEVVVARSPFAQAKAYGSSNRF